MKLIFKIIKIQLNLYKNLNFKVKRKIYIKNTNQESSDLTT